MTASTHSKDTFFVKYGGAHHKSSSKSKSSVASVDRKSTKTNNTIESQQTSNTNYTRVTYFGGKTIGTRASNTSIDCEPEPIPNNISRFIKRNQSMDSNASALMASSISIHGVSIGSRKNGSSNNNKKKSSKLTSSAQERNAIVANSVLATSNGKVTSQFPSSHSSLPLPSEASLMRSMEQPSITTTTTPTKKVEQPTTPIITAVATTTPSKKVEEPIITTTPQENFQYQLIRQ
eukprot:TRINITY_DN1443_c0_g2_i2.p1 TRINITY_DN1443_c0_g2~~TRINITY_DN1443_c0_g2_i2.p1  ORF type:complete len:234 (-),score=67.48 TRINITY_DN1443_c0_g2_i2:196-897(-)